MFNQSLLRQHDKSCKVLTCCYIYIIIIIIQRDNTAGFVQIPRLYCWKWYLYLKSGGSDGERTIRSSYATFRSYHVLQNLQHLLLHHCRSCKRNHMSGKLQTSEAIRSTFIELGLQFISDSWELVIKKKLRKMYIFRKFADNVLSFHFGVTKFKWHACFII